MHWRQRPAPYLTADEEKYYAGTIDPVNGQVIDSGSERGDETDDALALRHCAAGAPS